MAACRSLRPPADHGQRLGKGYRRLFGYRFQLLPCWFCLVLWTGLTVPAQAVSGEPELGSRLAEAAAALERGESAAAEEAYRRLVGSHPGLVEAHDGLARALTAQGRSRKAAAVLFRLGEGLLEGGDYPAAAGYLERAVALAPGAAAAHGLLGRALLLDQAFEQGGGHLERAVELGDRSLATRLYLASALWENGRTEEAEELLRKLAAESGAFAPRHQLGRLLLWQGRYAEAVEVLATLAPGRRRGVDVELDLAQALEGAERIDEALAAYRRVVALEPERSPARYRLALLLHRSGQRQAGDREMAAFRRLYREEQERVRREGLARGRLQRGWELLSRGRPGEALDRFSSLPETPATLRGVALAYSALGRHAEAVATLSRAIALAPDRSDLRLLLADERLALAAEAP